MARGLSYKAIMVSFVAYSACSHLGSKGDLILFIAASGGLLRVMPLAAPLSAPHVQHCGLRASHDVPAAMEAAIEAEFPRLDV